MSAFTHMYVSDRKLKEKQECSKSLSMPILLDAPVFLGTVRGLTDRDFSLCSF